MKSNNNDARDAEAICEVVTRPSMRLVVVRAGRSKTCLRCIGCASC
jgi:transposase